MNCFTWLSWMLVSLLLNFLQLFFSLIIFLLFLSYCRLIRSLDFLLYDLINYRSFLLHALKPSAHFKELEVRSCLRAVILIHLRLVFIESSLFILIILYHLVDSFEVNNIIFVSILHVYLSQVFTVIRIAISLNKLTFFILIKMLTIKFFLSATLVQKLYIISRYLRTITCIIILSEQIVLVIWKLINVNLFISVVIIVSVCAESHIAEATQYSIIIIFLDFDLILAV